MPRTFKTSHTPLGLICRFLIPTDPQEGPTKFGAAGNFELHRTLGCEYVNAYVEIFSAVLKFNHDLKFLFTSEPSSLNILIYLTKYFTKEQLCIENQPLLFANGFLHAIRLKERQQAADPERTPLSIGTSTLLSLQAHFTNVLEIASLKFVRGGESPFVYRSADIVQVNLWKPLRIINPDIPTHVTVNPNQPYL